MFVQNVKIITLGLVTLSFHAALNPWLLNQIEASTATNDNFQLELEVVEPLEDPRPTLPERVQDAPQFTSGVTTLPLPFSFSIEGTSLDFGILSATNPVIRNNILTVSSPGSGYQVFAFENQQLASNKNISIPDTTCDNGSCSNLTASIWQNNLTYGFGYRCDGAIQLLCSRGFEDKDAYKQFSNNRMNEPLESIMQSAVPGKNHQAEITYKVNISGSQQKEAYSNMVTFIAVPNF